MMKQVIGILRIIGISGIITYVGLSIIHSSFSQIVLWVTLASYTIVILLQLYRFYIKSYLKSEDNG